MAGDFNGDGIPDLVAYYDPDSLTVLLGNGAGGFSTESYLSPAPGSYGGIQSSAVAGDFNGDGLLDIAFANTGTNTLTVLLGNGLAGFTLAPGGADGDRELSSCSGGR